MVKLINCYLLTSPCHTIVTAVTFHHKPTLHKMKSQPTTANSHFRTTSTQETLFNFRLYIFFKKAWREFFSQTQRGSTEGPQSQRGIIFLTEVEGSWPPALLSYSICIKDYLRWFRYAKIFSLRWLVRENIMDDVDEKLWPNTANRV